MTSPKSYCSILKTYLVLLHDDKFITNFKEKTDIFNDFFAKQCSFINANKNLSSVLSKKTHKLLSTIHFTSDDILKIIKSLTRIKRMVMI